MIDRIELKPLSEEQIAQNEHALADLWILRHEGQAVGPFHTTALSAYADMNQKLLGHFEATNLLANNFKNFYQNTVFQRREPKLVQASSLVAETEFHILKAGQKFGPISTEDLKEEIKNHTIKLSDQLSTDKGYTWIKIYEHHLFDRRSREAESELPFIPNEEVLRKAIECGERAIAHAKTIREEEDAMVGLAFLSHGKEHAQKAEQAHKDAAVSSNFKQPSRGYKSFASFAVMALVVLGLYANFSGQKSEDNNFPTTTKVKAINNSARAPKQVRRMPASVNKVNAQKPAPRKRVIPKAKVQVRKRVQPKRHTRSANTRTVAPKRPRRITHFADEFDKIDITDPEQQDELDRKLAGEEEHEPEMDENSEELTQEQIEAIELGDPEMLENP